MNPRIIGAIIRKDLLAYSRDRLWVILSALTLVLLVVIFWLLPATVDETITVGISHEDLGEVAEQLTVGGDERQALDVVDFGPRAEALQAAVEGSLSEADLAELPEGADEVTIGIQFAPDFKDAVEAGRESEVTIYVDAAVPSELRTGISSFVRELAFGIAGQELPITEPAQEEIILGDDRVGNQVSLREQMRPMFAFLVLLVESFALAALIAEEISGRTVTAILVTPARAADVLAAKALMGTGLALGQALVFLVAVRAFSGNVGALLLAVALGALMSAAVGMIAGSAGRDFMGTIFYGLIFFIPLSIPAIAGLFPGTASAWVQVLPSHGVVQAIIGATSYAEGWGELAGDLTMAAAWNVALLAAGFLVLRRKVETL